MLKVAESHKQKYDLAPYLFYTLSVILQNTENLLFGYSFPNLCGTWKMPILHELVGHGVRVALSLLGMTDSMNTKSEDDALV